MIHLGRAYTLHAPHLLLLRLPQRRKGGSALRIQHGPQLVALRLRGRPLALHALQLLRQAAQSRRVDELAAALLGIAVQRQLALAVVLPGEPLRNHPRTRSPVPIGVQRLQPRLDVGQVALQARCRSLKGGGDYAFVMLQTCHLVGRGGGGQEASRTQATALPWDCSISLLHAAKSAASSGSAPCPCLTHLAGQPLGLVCLDQQLIPR